MSQTDAGHTLRYLTTQFRSLQGLRLVPISLLSFYDPASRAGWFGWHEHDGTMTASIANTIAFAIAVLAWWLIGRYYRTHYGMVGTRRMRWGFWLVWVVYIGLVPIGRRVNIDLSSLWLAALCMREASLSQGFRPHYMLVAGALCMWSFVPLVVSYRNPAMWTMQDLLNGTCGIIIGIGDHLTLRRMMQETEDLAEVPPPPVRKLKLLRNA